MEISMSLILITGANRPNSRFINDIVYIYFRLKQGREDSLHIMFSRNLRSKHLTLRKGYPIVPQQFSSFIRTVSDHP